MAALREQFPSAFISVVVGPKGETLLNRSRTIDEVIVYRKKELNLIGKIKFVMALRRKHFDLVIDLRNTAMPFLTGARCFNSPFFDNRETQMRKRHLSRLQFLGINESKNRFHFFSPEEEKAAQNKFSAAGLSNQKPVITVAPGAGSYEKRWPIQHYAEIARHFQSKGFQIAVVGSRDEKVLGDEILKDSGGGMVNLCGILEIRELAAFLIQVSLLISNDSAVMHLANELEKPVVAVFGPTDDRKYAKSGLKNRVIREGFELRNEMTDIQTQTVIRVSEELLNAPGN